MPSFKDTLNLPHTSFPMKANLVQNEPASLKRWESESLYTQLRDARGGAPLYRFHDGPPYANGDIHLGHLLNKVLKDLVVRTRSMMGLDCPYIPGWDCHGLPIEHKVMQELGDKARTMDALQVRRKCKAYAEKFVKQQAGQMKRLLTLADYENPYLTMDPRYEAAVLEVFASLVERGLVYRGLKPVHWSIDNQTALAEAELEYEDRTDTSAFVRFDALDPHQPSLLIWTTTPWTLPANLAVAVHPDFDYGVYSVRGHAVLIVRELAGRVLSKLGVATHEPLATLRGAQLVGLTYRHPFMDRQGRVLPATYVTLEDGSGLVHTAPGHGVEDYQTGMAHGLDVYCPVRGDGTFDDTVPAWLAGRSVWEANGLVLERLRASGHLMHAEDFVHSYPHDWRSRTPVIFRATHQWFVGVDANFEQPEGVHGSLRQRAMAAAEQDVNFFPAWGRNRLRGMLESRPDWCISRQRAWGLPIPVFFTPDGQPLLTPASVRAVASVFAQKGSDAWFTLPPEQLLASFDADGIDVSQLTKGHDIFDVWFESGSSWHACIRERLGGAAYPLDLYLEGSDQHRGWFQLSLLPALGVTGLPPFRGLLTHGFMVDRHGRKMSKSLGNALNVEDLLKQHGADVCRWWVASLNTEADIKVDPEYFNLAGEAYRKVRNTLRYLLSNLDTPREVHALRMDDIAPTSLEAWVLDELMELTDEARRGYEQFQFRRVTESIFNFCNDTLSAVYASAVKDRLYCDKADSPRRRATQAAMHTLADTLIRLLAPILPHTADEAWRVLYGPAAASVHLSTFPEPVEVPCDERWGPMMLLRDGWLRAIEQAKATRGLDNPLDMGLIVPHAEGADLRGFDPVDLADLCGVSRFAWGDALEVQDLTGELRCDRSWKRDGTVRELSWQGDPCRLSARDAATLGLV